MRKLWITPAVAAFAALAGCISTPIPDSGPLRVRNQHPVQLTAIHGDPRPARPVEAGRIAGDLRFDWTNLWVDSGSGDDEWGMDGELLRAEIDVRVGLGENLDVEVGLPVLFAGGGALDGFIEGWHDFFGMKTFERDEFPRGRFDVFVDRMQGDGTFARAYEMEDHQVSLGDVPIFLTWFPYREEGLSLGVRAGVELPTGDEDAGFGNGGLDAYLGFLGGYDQVGWSVFFWGGHALVATADRADDAGLDYSNVTSFGVGGQAALTDWLFALVQVEWESSVLSDLDDSDGSKDQLVIWGGGRIRITDDMDFEFAVGEELILDVSPDITLHFALTFRF